MRLSLFLEKQYRMTCWELQSICPNSVDGDFHNPLTSRCETLDGQRLLQYSSEISVHVYTCKASENFRNLQELLSFETRVMQSAFEFHHGSCSHIAVTQRKSSCVSSSIANKTSPILRQINSNFKELAIFPSRIKSIVSRKFSRIVNTVSEPKIGHVTDRQVCYRWWPDKPRIVWCYKIDMMLFIYTVCLHLEQAFETIFKEMKLDIDALEETFAL